MEKYLNKCLDSLIVENMDLMEVLVINDGSKDNSSKIAHEYENKYPNTFRVIDKENGNYGSCINKGLKEASGKYIKVLDADDSFDNQELNSFLNKLININADLIFNDFIVVNEDNVETSFHSYTHLNDNTKYDFKSIHKSIGLNIEMHRITYLRKNLLKIGYTQTEGISYTDQEWIHLPMTTVNTIYYIKTPLYRYLIGREGQTMNPVVLAKSFKQLTTVVQKLMMNYIAYEPQDAKKEYLLDRIYANLYVIYANAIINKIYPCQDFTAFDNEVKQWETSLNERLENLIISSKIPFKYVKHWRKHHKFLPSYISIINRVLSYIIAIKNSK